MKREMTGRSMIVLVGTLVAMVHGACGTVDAPALYITGNVLPSDDCVVKAQGGVTETRPIGALDLAVGTRWVGYFAVKNNFPGMEELTGLGVEDARLEAGMVTLDGVDIKMRIDRDVIINNVTELNAAATSLGIEPITTTDFTISYTRPAAGLVEPGGGTSLIVDGIPANIGRWLRYLPTWVEERASIEVILEIVAFGRRHDMQEVRSGTFNYPVTICYGCLVSHEHPLAIATNPLEPDTDPDDALDPDEILDFCVAGSDQKVTNALCGFLWGPKQGNDPCKFNRCMGLGGEIGSSLVCTTDGLDIPVPNTGFVPIPP